MMWHPTPRKLVASLVFCTLAVTPVLSVATGASTLGNDKCGPRLPVSERRAREILASERPFELEDPGLFYSWEHPGWADVSPPESPDGPALDETDTRDALADLLSKRFPCTPDDVRRGLAVFDDPVASQKLPDPSLRAALAALVGTIGEPAIPYLLDDPSVTSIHFGVGFMTEENGVSLRYAVVWGMQTDQIVIDRKDRFSHFGVFSAMLFHEALHIGTDGEGAGEVEEVIATALQALVYMEMVLADPALVEGSEAFTRSLNNHNALLRLNSGPPGSDRMTLLLPGSNVNLDPTAVEPITQFYDLYGRIGAPDDPSFAGRPTPGNELLQTVLEDLAEPGESAPPDAGFDAATVEFLNRNHATLTSAELIAVACILRLDVECD